MSDPSLAVTGASLCSHPPYDRPPRLALAEMPADARAVWRERYSVQDEAELRVQAILERAETALRSAGKSTTIRALWMALTDALLGKGNNADLRAATALAAMAMGLKPS